MRTDLAPPQPTRLADYQPPAFSIDTVRLEFALDPAATRVKATLGMRRTEDGPLVLDGARLKTISVALDGRPLSDTDYALTETTLTLTDLPAAFTLQTVVELDPSSNTALEGLYLSGGRFCTQCEPEGFRTITWFLDRPDVLSRYTVRIEAGTAFPHLLSNGNKISEGALDGGRHFAEWEDPFPKPAYLFALVAGELDVLESAFTHHERARGGPAHLRRPRHEPPRRIRDGRPEAVHALGRDRLWPRIRPRPLHDRGRARLQFRGDGEQGAEYLQQFAPPR